MWLPARPRIWILLISGVTSASSDDVSSSAPKEDDVPDGPTAAALIRGGLHWQDLGVALDIPVVGSVAQLSATNTSKTWSPDTPWLLSPSSGYVPNGCICAILGPSGAGKSTFLNAIGGTTPKSSELHLTGSVWYEEDSADDMGGFRLSHQKGEIAMLHQHDNFFEELTPRESLNFAAYLEGENRRLRSLESECKVTPEYKATPGTYHADTDRKLTTLGLQACADRKIGDRSKLGGPSTSLGWGIRRKRRRGASRGGLSGGERRRLSVAIELLSEPRVFLADEPSTGLDSAQAEKVVKLIKKLSIERGIPSICSLHQPKTAIWDTLDYFILLAPGGKMCYAGKRDAATSYFEDLGYKCPLQTNPAEYLIDLVTIDTDDPTQSALDEARINSLHHSFVESISGVLGKEPSLAERNTEKQSYIGPLAQVRRMKIAFNRFSALLRRSLKQNVRNTRLAVLRLGAVIIQAEMFSIIFASVKDDNSRTKSIADRVALLTFGVVNMSIMSMMKTLDLFAKERSVVMREQMRRTYSPLEYVLAKVVAEIPLDSFFSLTFAAMLKYLTGLRSSLRTLAGTFCLMTVSSVSLGFAVGSITSSVESAMSLGVPLMVIFMIVGVINPSGVDSSQQPNQLLTLLKALSPIRWAIEALVTAEFQGMEFGKRNRWGQLSELKDLPAMGALAVVKNGDEVLANLGLKDAQYSILIQNLVWLSTGYLVFSWAGLTFFGPLR